MSCHGAGRWARTARYSGCSKKPWRGGFSRRRSGKPGTVSSQPQWTARVHMRWRSARDSVGQTSGATQCCLNLGFSERFGNSSRTGLTDGAIYWHLKQIYHKLPISRQVDLVRLVLSLAEFG